MEPVGIASDGEEAVKLANELKPDVVVMDISMPRLNGIEATRRIKEELGVRPRESRVPWLELRRLHKSSSQG